MQMLRKNERYRAIVTVIIAVGSSIFAACSLDKQDMPALTGPSEFGLALTMTAAPDSIPRDGSSQSVVTVTARDAAGHPVVVQRISVALGPSAPQGAGLSQTEVTTGSTGQATFAVVAPIAGSIGNITVNATPVGDNAGNATSRTISIAALPTNSAAPVVTDFTISNSTPDIGEVVTFD